MRTLLCGSLSTQHWRQRRASHPSGAQIQSRRAELGYNFATISMSIVSNRAVVSEGQGVTVFRQEALPAMVTGSRAF
jgi:hypothetical protein